MLLASVVPLRAEYLYPKQDYLGAMKFLDEQQQPGELILTAGAVTTPYQRYYGRQWPIALTRSQLDTALLGDHATWLVYAMPNSIRTSQPEVWDVIESKFTVVRAFPGTLGGGTIYVSKSKRQMSSTSKTSMRETPLATTVTIARSRRRLFRRVGRHARLQRSRHGGPADRKGP